jgi:UDP-N-acetylmuramoyl-tripeptide--D-alanyl-D-alanine ligase
MIPLTLAEIAAATSGRIAVGADADAVVTGPVVIDSRQAVPGALFAALPGERVDGHDYAAVAAAKRRGGGARGPAAARGRGPGHRRPRRHRRPRPAGPGRA